MEKKPQVHLIIVREKPKNTPSILRNLDNLPPVRFIFIHARPYNKAQKSIHYSEERSKHVNNIKKTVKYIKIK